VATENARLLSALSRAASEPPLSVTAEVTYLAGAGTKFVPEFKRAISTYIPRDNPRIDPLFPQVRQTPASDRQ
jgi:hypothetical protein